MTKHRRGIGGRRADLENRYFRSRWEANWARYLNFLKQHGKIKDWQYEPRVFEFVGIKRGSRTYTPDFLITNIDGTEFFQEVKGWMDPKSATKIARMGRYFPRVKLEIISRTEYRKINDLLGRALPGWEKAQC